MCVIHIHTHGRICNGRGQTSLTVFSKSYVNIYSEININTLADLIKYKTDFESSKFRQHVDSD